ncbi:pyridoxal phosphate enzyme, YggS family [Aeromicrobium marinum DSM 15272]|uniref:Pyridoxal phosphate homeostasis protein n=1 Tax=Aeromicrobium marinum DSM 15272 TaxID=585531 RepID=E2S959_9ACTN|nr:YggS family pyridoxal phosphate-dependent enzyme [Aeromicrobium marinum]EFQ84329.1 pyridoxal phosphate enzyme, YggS family [Aeromicrobium marinum DSM 15272]
MSRREELAAGLRAVEARIDAACAGAGRRRADITLVVVTKTHPASDVEILADLGVRHVGENRHPEAGRKAEEVAADLTWHFLGAVQTNKAGAVTRYADVVHSVDRPKLVASLSRGAVAAGRELGALVQVDLGPAHGQESDGRSGALPAEVERLAALVADAEGLRLDGVMTVAPLGVPALGVFDDLREIAEAVRRDHPGATTISAGMSADLEQAVAAGATHLRVGRSILGERPALG